MDLFRKWRKDFSSLDVHLVKGNHDILDDNWYSEADIQYTKEQLLLKNFLFVHDITKIKEVKADKGHYIFSGHIHPGISIRGRGKAITAISLFLFCKTYCILPAFSRFTGTYKVEPKKARKYLVLLKKM